ncbi:MAG: hypothetical protein E6P95_03130 [Candidatus Moraniibacteriota bacterium]|nr:MAG: hypothetical protein E6P95_03130 [Candidatus Moranbacteria bacterium]
MYNTEFASRLRYDGWRIAGDKGSSSGEGRETWTAVGKWGENSVLEFVWAFEEFNNDVSLLGHYDPSVLPWDSPNPVGLYTLTQLPEKWKTGSMDSMRELGKELEQTTDIVLSCMDKDVAHGVHRTVKQSAGWNPRIFGIFVGGGPVQNKDRQIALDKIGFYFYKIRQHGGLPNLRRIWTIAHNHQCGAVKHFLGGVALHDYLSQLLNEKVEKKGQTESGVMLAMARNGVYRFEETANMSPNLQMFVGLADTFRDGRGGVRLISAGSGPKLSVDSLDSDFYVRQAGKYIKFT